MRKLMLVAAVLIPLVAVASAIKTWSSAENLTASDLNSNFQHLHANLGHGHGAIVTNADISGSAAIATSKLAGYSYIPKGWLGGTQLCDATLPDGTVCNLGAQGIYQGIAAITTRNATAGQYSVWLSALPNDNKFATIVGRGGGTVPVTCIVTTQAVGTLYPNVTTPQIQINCVDGANVPTNAVFTLIYMDN